MIGPDRTGGGYAFGRVPALVVVALLVALGWWPQDGRGEAVGAPSREGTVRVAPAELPPAGLTASLPGEARATLTLVERGAPFPHPQVGEVFSREGHLPQRERGFHREYTVETPGLDHRGGRRIVTGGKPPRVYYYTDDHYDSFRRFEPNP